MPGRDANANLSARYDNPQDKEGTLPSNNRSNATTATAGRSLIATAAAFATLAALAFVLLHPAAGDAAQAKGPIVSTARTSLGRILVGPRGNTLYLFEKDKNGKSACVGQCATFWPPLIATGKPIAAAGTRASMLGTTKRADGRLQVTYNHHPLYTFAKDTKKGQTNGEGVIAFGGQWFVVSPAGVRIAKSKSSSTTTPAPGYGY
jgi:predicted lipoprotein with Yx(FWY)xxD motif